MALQPSCLVDRPKTRQGNIPLVAAPALPRCPETWLVPINLPVPFYLPPCFCVCLCTYVVKNRSPAFRPTFDLPRSLFCRLSFLPFAFAFFAVNFDIENARFYPIWIFISRSCLLLAGGLVCTLRPGACVARLQATSIDHHITTSPQSDAHFLQRTHI